MRGNNYAIVVLRTAIIVPTFIIGCLSIVYTQFVSIFFFKNQPASLQSLINITKTHFVLLLVFVTNVIQSIKIQITLEKSSIPNFQSFYIDQGNNLHSLFLPNSILISNHQIYTDWLFLWFLTYTSKMSNSVYIILKDLSKIPVLGYGMKNYKFLFLSRKWQEDKIILTNQLLEIDANARGVGPANGVKLISGGNEIKKWPKGENSNQIWPFELILFPEGTVPSDRTTKKSAEFLKAKGRPELKHVLSPRIRGLFLALKKLKNSVEMVYDITTAYSNLKEGEYGEIKFSLKEFYLKGNGPPVVNYYIKGYRIDEIPLGLETDDIDNVPQDELDEFENWLLKVWYEKDQLMDNFYKFGSWNQKEDTKTIIGDFKLRKNYEFIMPFSFVIITFLIIRVIYIFIKRFI
ncbi:unnamed protein product [Candida verbasci]|uniref:Phospholipid/glycerol acyltransferase domain-containing protein n=1 Tax=Candida verbasci TaxID=1227364 RepID=A0A9W4U0Y6_9ASCO|nr:unnamed protein product [Candida verbasci]